MPNLSKNKYWVLLTILLFCAKPYGFAQNWEIVGNGLNDVARDINVDTATNSLFIGGDFMYADTMACYGIVNWDGNVFSKLNPPINNCTNTCNDTRSIIRYHNRLFMNGHYGPYNGKQEQIFEYVNNNWVVSCEIGNGGISYLKVINDKLFAFGIFASLCGQNTQSLAVFNGTDWEKFNPPSPIFYSPSVSTPSYWFFTGEYYKGEYYFGGNFADGNFKEIIRWTGTQWAPVKSGIKGGLASVGFMKVFHDILYVGGYWLQSDGNAADRIMGWDGQNWFNPFPQIQYISQIMDMEIINDQLYISGNYIIPADNDSNMYVLARFNGCDFSAFGGVCKYPEQENPPTTIAGLKGRIYVSAIDSFFHKSSKYLISIPENTPDHRTVHISDCPVIQVAYSFNVFPNPYSDIITVQLSSDFPLSETKFTLTNNLGQLLFTYFPSSNSHLLDLSSFSSGMYFLTVEDRKNRKTVKIIKQ